MRQAISTDGLEQLIEDSRSRTEALERTMQQGRDRLLELNSHDPAKAAETISIIQKSERPEEIFNFAELLFDRIGISQPSGCITIYLMEIGRAIH